MLDFARLFVAAGGLDRIADPGAVHQDAFLPMGLTRLGETGIDILVAGHVDLAEHAADFGGQRGALFLVHVEDRDLCAFGGERARSRRAEAGCTAGDDGGGIG